jgi:CRISPR-associated protein (TIGR02584 family)
MPSKVSSVPLKVDNDLRLFMLVGLSPAVLSETLWALARTEPWRSERLPAKVHVLTTPQGLDRLMKALLLQRASEKGDDVEWGPNARELFQVVGWPGEGPALVCQLPESHDDALSAEALLQRADRLYRSVAAARAQGCRIHLGLGGGFNADSHFAGNVMSMLGQARDRMSQVRVSAEFEDSPDFLHPDMLRQVRVLYDKDGVRLSDNRPNYLSASAAEVRLIPLFFGVRQPTRTKADPATSGSASSQPKLSFAGQILLLDLARENSLPPLKLCRAVNGPQLWFEFASESPWLQCRFDIEVELAVVLRAVNAGSFENPDGMKLPLTKTESLEPGKQFNDAMTAACDWAERLNESLQQTQKRKKSRRTLPKLLDTADNLSAKGRSGSEYKLRDYFVNELRRSITGLKNWFDDNLGCAAEYYWPQRERGATVRTDTALFKF